MKDAVPLLSIIIANYNYGRFLEDAIRSVLDQSCQDYELIIVDGGSTDGSVNIIRKYEEQISWWCSEKDSGQSNAFNKGFSHARGRFLTWLNSDDILLPDTIETLLRSVKRNPRCHWFTGNHLQFLDSTRRITFAPWGPHILPKCVQTENSPLAIFGPTTFWSREAYIDVGPIDESLHYSMDTDYWLRMRKCGYLQKRMSHCCWAFRQHIESKTAQYEGKVIEETIRTKWFAELAIVNGKACFTVSRTRQWLLRMFRVLDGSFVVSLFRRIFVVGSILDETYSIKNSKVNYE